MNFVKKTVMVSLTAVALDLIMVRGNFDSLGLTVEDNLFCQKYPISFLKLLYFPEVGQKYIRGWARKNLGHVYGRTFLRGWSFEGYFGFFWNGCPLKNPVH